MDAENWTMRLAAEEGRVDSIIRIEPPRSDQEVVVSIMDPYGA